MARGAATTPRVLVVEDDDLLGSCLERILQPFEVVVVPTIAAARPLVADPRWSAFMVDISLPDGRGTNLLPPIRERHPLTPVVVMTGNESIDHSRVALEHAAHFVAKPFDSVLFESVRALIRRGSGGSEGELRARLQGLGLTPREEEVIALLAQGVTAKGAAAKLGISNRTVQGHCLAACEKVGVGSLIELLAHVNKWL